MDYKTGVNTSVPASKRTSNMKSLLIYLAIAMIIISLMSVFDGVTALTDDKLKCQMNCDLQDYKPICGTDDTGETKTFNNLCILKTENCLRTSTFQKTGDGECP